MVVNVNDLSGNEWSWAVGVEFSILDGQEALFCSILMNRNRAGHEIVTLLYLQSI